MNFNSIVNSILENIDEDSIFVVNTDPWFHLPSSIYKLTEPSVLRAWYDGYVYHNFDEALEGLIRLIFEVTEEMPEDNEDLAAVIQTIKNLFNKENIASTKWKVLYVADEHDQQSFYIGYEYDKAQTTHNSIDDDIRVF